MAGEMQLPPWLSQSNTDLMPRAMVAGAQVGNVIADNKRMAAAAQQNADLAKQKQVQEAIRYQGFQDYQRDISNGVDVGKALQKHGAKMYFGETVFPQMLSAMERNAEAIRNHQQIESIRKFAEDNNKLNDDAKIKLGEEGNRIREANAKQANDLAIKTQQMKADQIRQNFGENQYQFDTKEARLQSTADVNNEFTRLKIESEKKSPGGQKFLAIEGAIERAVTSGKMTEEEGVKVLRANLGADPKQRAEATRDAYIMARLPFLTKLDEDNVRKRSVEARIKQAGDEWDKIKESTQAAEPKSTKAPEKKKEGGDSGIQTFKWSGTEFKEKLPATK